MYSVDYIQKEIETLSPDKRDASIIAWNKPAALDIQNLHDNLFFTYKQFQSLPQWVSGMYARNDKVIYKKAIYQSLIDSNNEEPTFGNNWILISPNFLGSDVRFSIKGEKLLFEKYINVWFGTTFRQPAINSDIYTVANTNAIQSPFKVGFTEVQSSKVRTIESVDFIGLNYSFSGYVNFSIYIPVLVYNGLGTDNSIRDNIVRDFTDKYVTCGIKYNIIPY